MKPFIKPYTNDETLQDDIKKLTSKDISADDIYVISHDDDRTERITKNAGVNTIGVSESGVADTVKSTFEKQGDTLRKQLQNVGFSETEAENYESDMDEGKVFLIVTNNENVGQHLA
ncbi:general stress protein [Salinicoccus sp. ID82-1]|uniref:General stress protein n=1 Tax=Salinicoccus cyprini TaxID=2493691 RepID=A0A558AV71_9STAP|nr:MULTISPECIES: general stress protein [Salinicoccus]MCG1010463.1 general stress protein [Salinicoccus sp. ID82-1]TVT28163.1 general stress protein [Salinicoccus cyprini]